MPKKKKSHGHPAHRGGSGTAMSPLRAGGRVLGDLQVPFRRFLEAELAEQDEAGGDGAAGAPMDVGDLEARLMESLGWLVLSLELDLVPASARWFSAEGLQELFTEIVPAVAEHNELDAQELVDETRLAWTSYLMFLGETEQWAGEDEELADCLDVASGGVGATAAATASVLDALRAAEEAVPPGTRLADLAALPWVTAALDAVDELAAGVDAAVDAEGEGPAVEVLRARLAPFDLPLDPVAEWAELQRNGFVTVVDGRTEVPRAGDPEHRGDLATVFAASVISGTLAAAGSPGAVVGGLSAVTSAVLDPMTSGRLRELLTENGDEADLPAALAAVQRLVELGVLSPVEPWTARAGLAGAVLDVVDGFFSAEPED